MSRKVGKILPKDVLKYLGDDPESKPGRVLLLATMDSTGWPRIAMLSLWEVHARDVANIRIATYDSSTTTENLLNDGRGTLLLIDKHMAYYVKGRASLVKRHAERDSGNSIFNLRVIEVLEDKLPGTKITSGIRFEQKPGIEPHAELFAELKTI
jgi:hypothetical protein